MPFNTPLPAENTDPWYTPLVVNFIGGLRTFVNALEATVGLKAEKTYVDNQLLLKADQSTLTTGLAGKIDTSQRGANSGVATLDAQGKLLTSQLPALAVTEYLQASANQAAMLAKVGQQGDWTIRTDLGTVWVITGADPTQLASWTQMGYPSAPVTTVNGKAGIVVLTSADVGAATAQDLADFEALALQSLEDLSDVVATKAAEADLTALQGTVTTLQGTVGGVATDANNAFTTAQAAQTTANAAIPSSQLIDTVGERGVLHGAIIALNGTAPVDSVPLDLIIEKSV